MIFVIEILHTIFFVLIGQLMAIDENVKDKNNVF